MRRSRLAASLAAGAAACNGAFWLTLWLSDSNLALASASSKTNTSLALLLTGTAYVLLLSQRARLVAWSLLGVAGAIGVITLLQYSLGVDLGIDQLLARDRWSTEATMFPNRMSPSAALCFVLLALSGALLPRPGRAATALGQGAAVLALVVSGVALVGYLYSASLLYRPLPFLRISPYTAASNLLLSCAAFALRPDAGLTRVLVSSSLGGYLARRLLPITLLLPVAVGWLLLDARRGTLLSPADSHALLASTVALVMGPTVLFLALSLDRLERGRREAEDFLRRASELTSALSRARNVDDVIKATLDLGLPALGARAGAFLLLSADGKELEAAETRGYAPGSIDGYVRFSIDAPYPVALAVRRREAVFIESPAERARQYPELPEVKANSSWAALPLEGNRGPIGAIALSFELDQTFDPATRERARQLAWQCAQALERALLFDSEKWARERAEAASRAKDEFLAMLGHELRNPLSPILTSLHLMDLRGGQDFAREREVIGRQVRHMVRLVDDLLDVSRIASGRVELRKATLELSDVVRAALELVAPLLEQRRHEVSVDVPERGLLVDGDRERLVQVLSNLLNNSAKYTSPGGHIAVRARRAGAQVIVEVSDDGAGIAPELLPKVFDLFVQGKRTLERSEGGLGLGLSLVRSLVQLHGGDVEATSEGLGEGSKLTVTLPAAPGESPAPSRLSERLDSTAIEPRSLLLVDDNRDAADSMARALRQAGHEVRVAYDGEAALALVSERLPDVAFLDIGLPILDGYELARRLRRLAQGRTLTLVAVTGYGQKADRERSRHAGFDHHLVKPVAVTELLQLTARAAPQEIRRSSPAPRSLPESDPAA